MSIIVPEMLKSSLVTFRSLNGGLEVGFHLFIRVTASLRHCQQNISALFLQVRSLHAIQDKLQVSIQR